MRYFTVRGANSQEALAEMRRQYGPDACIQSHRTIRVGGVVLGLFARPAGGDNRLRRRQAAGRRRADGRGRRAARACR